METEMKKRVMITGGTGNLGGRLRTRLNEMGFQVRIMSRRQPRPDEGDNVEWAVADLVSGEGIHRAIRDVDVIVHCASSPFARNVEIDGGRHLITAAQDEGVEHFVYISIVGVDEIPFPYYESKRTVELMVAKSGLPYSILRATQFHQFVGRIVETLAKLPIVFLPRDWRFQTVSAGDVADRLAAVVRDGPRGRMPAIAGPEVLSLDEMLRAWMVANEVRKPVLKVPLPGALSSGFRAGHNLRPDRAVESLGWTEYVRGRERLVSRSQREARAA